MIPGQEMAIKALGINEEFYLELVRAFMTQMEDTLKKMDEAFEKQDVPAMAKLGHFIKGASSNLRLEELEKIGHRIEFAKDQNLDSNAIQEAITDLKQKYLNLKSAVQNGGNSDGG